MSAPSTKRILVTGGNTGIGFALCKLLLANHGDTFVYLGSRDHSRGANAVKQIVDGNPAADSRIQLLPIDVGDDKSVDDAVASLKANDIVLYALVNNAGVGFNTASGNTDALINVNFYGTKRVTEAVLPLIDPVQGRIVNVSSGAAPGWLKTQSAEMKSLFTSSTATWEELESAVRQEAPRAPMGGYGLSKAAVTAYTVQQASAHPNLKITALSPGFINTAMTEGFGARLTPEQGCVSLMKCLFGDVTSGLFYGSDGLRSPMTVSRDPGTPEYQGEENPDPSKYNRG